MNMMRFILWLVSLVVPYHSRDRWREEWMAELRHGGWRMLTGVLSDARTMRVITREGARRARGTRLGIFHALDQDLHYATRALASGRSFTFAVIASLAVGNVPRR